MAEFFIEVLRYLVAPSLILALLAGVSYYYGKRWSYIISAVFVVSGLISAVAIYAGKSLYPKKLLRVLTRVNRQLLALSLFFLLGAWLLFLLSSVLRKREKLKSGFGQGAILFLSLAFASSISTTLPFVLLKTNDFIAFGETSFGTASLFRFSGFSFGFIVLFLLALSLFQNYRRLSEEQFMFYGMLLLTAVTADYFFKGISALARLHILKSSNDFVFKIMIFDDRNLIPLLVVYLILILLTAARVYSKHRKLTGEFATPAARRKRRWWLRNCRRWAMLASSLIIVIYLSLTFLHSFINRPVELTPPQEYQENDQQIIIPLEDVNDGHLHRFSYNFEGHDIRFIVVKKPQGNAYGLGLDACDICGVAGYYERNNDVICKRCDVVMNKATIGFRGGCNPVPFNYEIIDGKIVIDKSVLEAEKNRFPIKD